MTQKEIPRRKNTTLSPVNRCLNTTTEHSWFENMLCIWWDQKGLVYYELLKPSDSITSDRCRLQLIRLSHAQLREKRPEYEQKHDKVILLHNNARPHVAKVVKKYSETLKWDFTAPAVFSGHCFFWLFRRMQQVTGSLLLKSKIGSKIGSPPTMSHFFEMEFENYLSDRKKVVGSDGQYFN